MKIRDFFGVLALPCATLFCALPCAAQDTAAPAAAPAAAASLDDQLIGFFDGLMESVRAKEGSCEAMAEALKVYCQTHREWIASLDFATVHVTDQTVASIRAKSVEFGKMLSVCFDEKSATAIPKLLEYCAAP